MTTEPDGPLRLALASLQSLLQADGYDLQITRADASGLVLRISAGPEACSECLVPARIMEIYVRDALKDLPVWRDTVVDLQYPEPSS